MIWAKRIFAALLLSGFVCISRAQVNLPLMGVGGAASGGGYTGPLDVNGTAYAFWSTRCGSTSYTGNVIDVWDSATGSTTETLVTCSSGGVLNNTINPLATTCSGGCVVKTIYDQSGSNNCSGACNATQATNANRAALSTSCQNGKSCLQCTLSGASFYNTPTLTALAQPFTANWAGTRTGNFTTQGIALGMNIFNDVQFGFNATANTVKHWAGGGAGVQTASATDSSPASVQNLMNDTSSKFYINGSQTNDAGSPGNGSLSATAISICALSSAATTANANMTGNLFEAGIWGADKSANFSTYDSNVRTYWNF